MTRTMLRSNPSPWTSVLPGYQYQCLVRPERAQLGLSCEALANRCSISRGHMEKIETGKSCPSVPIAIRIAEELDVEVEDIFHVRKV
jgi:DNA-binding XRE family transcriptional regulator